MQPVLSLQHRAASSAAPAVSPGYPQCLQHQHLSRIAASTHAARLQTCSTSGQAVPNDGSEPQHSAKQKPRNFVQKARNWIFGGPIDKQRLQELGLGAIISYGFVSNVTYGAVFTIGWASHVAATGKIPFAAGQWQAFLGRVTGLLLAQQLLRPLRFSCAVALTPFVDRVMQALQRRFNVSKRASFLIMLVSLAALTLAGYGVALTSVTMANLNIK